MYCSEYRLSTVCGQKVDGREPSTWDSIRRTHGAVVDRESIKKADAFLFVLVRLRSQYYANN